MRLPCNEAVIQSGGTAVPCSGKDARWILGATVLGSSMAFIDSTAVNVALPALQASLQATVVDVQWVVESYGLFLGALILVGGSLGDLFGRRLIFMIGTALFAVASVGCGVALSVNQLLIARSIQGVGAALLVPGSLAIISTSFDQESRGRAIGTWSGFTAITTAVGPVLGGWLVEHASWRWVFFINLPVAAGVIAISLRHIPESRSVATGKIDWVGALAVTVGLGGVVNGFIESANLGWTHPLVLGSLIAGFASLFGFLLIESHVTSPMVPLSLFSSSTFSGTNLLTLFLYAAVGIFFFLLPLNLIQVQGYSATATGVAILPLILLMFILSRWSGGLVTRYGARAPLVVGSLIAALGFVLFALSSFGGDYWKKFFPAMVVLGFGLAVTVAPLTTVVISSVDRNRVGTASGINNAVARVAGVLAVAVLGIVMVNAFGSRLDYGLSGLSLPPGILHEVQMDKIKLGGLQPPAGIDPSTTVRIKQLVGVAFVFGFRIVMWICAALSVAGAVIARFMISESMPEV
jgi:EmrB/QacA subfamily drug resistance transporter